MAEAETTITTTETKVEAPAPSELDAFMKARGYTPEQVVSAVKNLEYANTPEGEKQLAAAVQAKFGKEIAAQVVSTDAEFLKTLDSKTRRSIRRAVARQDEQAEDVEDAPPDLAAEARDAAQAARKTAEESKALSQTTAQAVALAPKLVSFMTHNPVASANPEEWHNAVVPLLNSGHPRYQGPDGLKHAHEDVVNGWRRQGEMAGLKPEAAPSSEQKAGNLIPKDEDISARMQTAKAKGGKAAMLEEANRLALELDV